MFNKIITHGKNRLLFRTVTFSLIFSFILTMNGCTTVSTDYISEQDFIKDTDAKIISVEMKDGTKINLEGKLINYYPVYKDLVNVIVYENILKTVKTGDNRFNSITETKVIELKDVIKIKAVESKFNVGSTVLLVLGIIAVIGIIFYIIGLSASKKDLQLGGF
jgi:uncharacterized membrane protein